VIPLVCTSIVAGWLLCRLPDSPGPENAYPGFPVVIVVAVATIHVVGMLSRETTSRLDASEGAVAAVARIADALPGIVVPAAAGGAARLLPVVWLLAGLPLVAALLAMHIPLRRGWMVAAIWYAVMSFSLAHWRAGEGGATLPAVFASLGALAVFSCGKERRLVPFATLMLVGAAITGRDDLIVIVAIVAGAIVRDVVVAMSPGSRHRFVAFLPLLTPAVALAVVLAPDLLAPGGATSHGSWGAGVARCAMSTLLLATGLAFRNPWRQTRHSPPRALHAR
jgi:hypothetical protein